MKNTEKSLARMERLAPLDRIEEIKESLEKNDRQLIKCSLGNFLEILKNDPLLSGSLKFNILTQRIDVVKELWWNTGPECLTDAGVDFLCIYFEKYYRMHHQKNMEQAIRVIANDNRYHPIQDLLNSLEWDGTPRIRYVLKKFLGSDDSELTYNTLLYFMAGAIRRAFDPGCKFEEMLCLVGGQGAGKSTFFRFLAIKDEWFTDDLKRLDDEKLHEKIRGHWMIEMPEMNLLLSAKNVEMIKAFLSRQSDIHRIPYHQYAEDRPRQCVFAGTTNTKQFLPFDRSGSRRFLPVEVHPESAEVHLLKDEASARAYIIQAWAEAMFIYKTGLLPLKFPEELQASLEESRQEFTQEDTMAGKIRAWLDNYSGDYVCSLMIYNEALDFPDIEPRRSVTNAICQILGALPDWELSGTHRFTAEGYGTQRAYKRIRSGVNEADLGSFRQLTLEEMKDNPFYNDT